MNIGIITDTFPATSETWVTNEVQWLSKKGHRVTVVTRVLATSPQSLPVEVITIPMHYSSALRCLRATIAWTQVLLQRPSAMPMVLRAGPLREIPTRLIRTVPFLARPFDVLHVHFGSVGSQYSFLGRILGVDLVTTFHGYDLRRGDRDQGRRYLPLFRDADAIIAISEYSQRRLIEFGCPSQKINLVRLGVNLTLFHPNQDLLDSEATRIVTVARLAQEKNIPAAVRAIARLKQLCPRTQVRYRLIGEGPEKVAIRETARQCGVDVEFLGARGAEEISRDLRQSHIFLLPSDQEVAPVALIEAMASGLPVVASDVGAMSELVANGETGFVVPAGDEQAMGNALRQLVENSELQKEMGRKAHLRAIKAYDQEKQFQQLWRVLCPSATDS